MKIISQSLAGVATSTARVIELYYPQDKRLFNDQFALKLLPFWWRVMVRLLYLPVWRNLVLSLRERRMPGVLGSFLCRTRYIDDVLKKSLQGGIEQLVILGAGFDSRAYRITGMERVRVFEVDLPGTRELKRVRVEKVLGKVPENVTLVGMNFEQQNLGEVLKSVGFQKEKRTLFIWEGVTQYITAEAVNNTLAFVSGVSGTGSAIVFTYVLQKIIDGSDCPEWCRGFMLFARRVGSPWKFGLDASGLEQYLSDRGLRLIDDVGAAEYQDLYLKQLGREMNVFEGERIALAEVKAGN